MLRSLAMFAIAASLAAVCLEGVGCTHGEGLETTKIPDEIRADYEIFAHKCSKCHSLARPLSANITDDEQWVLYVNRMRRQPASSISPDDQTHILKFLRYYAAELRRKHAEKNGGVVPPSAQSVPVLTAPPGEAARVDGGGT